MTASLWVPGPLPSFNDMIAAAKGHGGRGYGYSKLKKAWTDTVWALAKAARMPSFQRARLGFLWVEKARRRDPDNVAAGGRKLVLDGLVKAGVLPEDGWDEVQSWTDTFAVGREPGVRVELVEVT
jgi:hypothetical protein